MNTISRGALVLSLLAAAGCTLNVDQGSPSGQNTGASNQPIGPSGKSQPIGPSRSNQPIGANTSRSHSPAVSTPQIQTLHGNMVVNWNDGSVGHGPFRAQSNSNGHGGTLQIEDFSFALTGNEQVPYELVARNRDGASCKLYVSWERSDSVGGRIQLWEADGSYDEGTWQASAN